MKIVPGSTATQFGIEGTKYCGPGYSEGRFMDPNEPSTPPAFQEPPNGPVDAACQRHGLCPD